MNHLVERIQRLPLDLRLFCIIPYTYEVQPPNLVHDIRTHRADTRILDNVYATMYNDTILLYDLKRFCQVPDIYTEAILLDVVDEFDLASLPKCFEIWKRHFSYKQMSNSQLYERITRFDTVHVDEYRCAMFIWGLLIPAERTMFINAYILDV